MTQLLTTVQKNNMTFLLEKFSLYLSILVSLLCAFLYGKYDGFSEGYNSATTFWTEGRPTLNGEKPIYELISETYFYTLVVLLFILFVHLIGKGILSKCVNLILVCFAAYRCLSIFHIKQYLLNFENSSSSYYDLIRQTIIFDVVGATAIIGLLIIQIILIFLILKKQTKDKSVL